MSGTVSYHDYDRGEWAAPLSLRADQAAPFTVEGLFDMVRFEVIASGRRDIQVAMDGTPAFPHLIIFGPVSRAGTSAPGTQSTVRVQSFDPALGDC